MSNTVRVSQKLKLAILQARCEGRRAYQIAQQAGLHPQVFSSLINDVRPVYEGNARVVAIGRVLGLEPSDCFVKTGSKA